MRRIGFTALALGAVLAGALGTPAAASTAADERVAPEIAAVMETVPGGVLIDGNHAVWPGLDMEMTVLPSQSRTSAQSSSSESCPSGRICLYANRSMSGSMVSWSTCGNHSIPAGFEARAMANARSSGYAQARNGTRVVATAYAGRSTGIDAPTDNVRCVL